MADDDQQCAYAKLWGRSGQLQVEFTAFVKHLPCRLGRLPAGVSESKREEDFIHLGNDKSISRHHATIDWLSEEGGYVITSHSKNGMVVDKTWRGRGGQSEYR